MNPGTKTREKFYGNLIEKKNQRVTALLDDLCGEREREQRGRIVLPSPCCGGIVLPSRSARVACSSELAEMLGNKLLEASKSDDCVKVSTLLSSPDAQSFINYQNHNGCTPLHAATANDHLNVTKVLIEARCNVNANSRIGRTPLITDPRRGFYNGEAAD